MNCIGHFGSPTGPSVYASEYVNDTGSTRGKALSILMNSRQKWFMLNIFVERIKLNRNI